MNIILIRCRGASKTAAMAHSAYLAIRSTVIRVPSLVGIQNVVEIMVTHNT